MTKGRKTGVLLFIIFIISLFSIYICYGDAITYPHRGFFELSLKTDSKVINPYVDVKFKVVFVRPDLSEVVVEGFYDGESLFKARAYCDMTGKWTWRSSSNIGDLNQKRGVFEVKASSLKGKLRLHKKDPRQFAYDNGE
ncbi:MAG: DUF5060 domain-containing protein, partial [Planctomycetota bacterium]